MSRFQPDTIYDRRQLHMEAKLEGLKPGNANAGITQVNNELCIFWNPFNKFYANKWLDEPREFVYSGEGSKGPMVDSWGNRTLIEAEETARPVTVFYKIKRTGSSWKCLGSFQVVEHEPGVSFDTLDNARPDIRFRIFGSEVDPNIALPKVASPKAPQIPDEDVLWSAVEKGVARGGWSRVRGKSSSRNKRQSDPIKTLYVLRRAINFGGRCELCLCSPGWVDDDGNPHFQAHHIEADVDLVDWIGAVCGTCHDRLHHGTDRVKRAEELRMLVKDRQIQLGRPTYELTGLPTPAAGT